MLITSLDFNFSSSCWFLRCSPRFRWNSWDHNDSHVCMCVCLLDISQDVQLTPQLMVMSFHSSITRVKKNCQKVMTQRGLRTRIAEVLYHCEWNFFSHILSVGPMHLDNFLAILVDVHLAIFNV